MKVVDLYLAYHCVSQPHKGDLTAKLKYRRFSSYFLCTLLLFPHHFLPSPVHPTGFSFCLFLPWLPCDFYLVVIEWQQHISFFILFFPRCTLPDFPCFFPGFLAIFTSLWSNDSNIFPFSSYFFPGAPYLIFLVSSLAFLPFLPFWQSW